MGLINTSAELKPHLPVPYGNTLESLPDFSLAEETYLIPIIGYELYAFLLAGNLNANHQELLLKCRAVIAPFGYLNHLEFLQVQLSDNGLVAVEGENTRKAHKWEFNQVREALTNRGYSHQELLILFLQKNKSNYPLWTNSPYNSPDFPLIRNGFELGNAIAINQPHRCFMTLKPLFAEVGELTIKECLGEDFYNALNVKILANNTTSDETALLRPLRMAAARLVMRKASQAMNVRYSASSGFTIVDTIKDNVDEGRKNANDAQLSAFSREMELSANAFLDNVRKTLNEKASTEVFPVYFSSSKYINPHVSGLKHRNGRKGMFTTS